MTLPSIPDNINKLILLIGIVLFGYAILDYTSENISFNAKEESYNNSIDSLNIGILKVEHKREQLVKLSDFVSKRNNISNPISLNDSTIYFNRAISGSKSEVLVTDSLQKFWEEFLEFKFDVELYKNLVEIKKDNLDSEQNKHENKINLDYFLIGLGLFAFIIGFIGMAKNHETQNELLKRQLNEKPKVYLFCQSCGKRFNSMRQHGKNNDSSLNAAFCCNCYDNGVFTEPELTYKDFKQRAESEIDKFYRKPFRLELKNRIRSLERWNPDDY